jgi:transcriptional regulator with XRE-family HTH domain
MRDPNPSPMLPPEAAKLLAGRVKSLRLRRKWKRSTLAERAGVSPSSLKRFETSGKVSLESLLKLAYALGRLHEFGELLKSPKANSIAELEAECSRKIRKRGRL